MDFPAAAPSHLPVISTFSRESLGVAYVADHLGAPSAVSWPASNFAIYVPFVIRSPYLVRSVFWVNGTIAAHNVDCGVLSGAGTKLLSSGSTGQAGTLGLAQSVTLGTPYLLSPASYYFAMAVDSITTSQFFRGAAGFLIPPQNMAGMAQQATAFPIPATATFATTSNLLLPMCGISSRTVV